jgi:hypothetical protein
MFFLVLSEVQGYSLFPNTFHKISTPQWQKRLAVWVEKDYWPDAVRVT